MKPFEPKYIVVVMTEEPDSKIVCATIAYSEMEGKIICDEWDDGYYHPVMVECDYSMRSQ